MYAGSGGGPMLAAASAWDGLAAELHSAAAGYNSVLAGGRLAGGGIIRRHHSYVDTIRRHASNRRPAAPATDYIQQ